MNPPTRSEDTVYAMTFWRRAIVPDVLQAERVGIGAPGAANPASGSTISAT
jgi:hypothetical protein